MDSFREFAKNVFETYGEPRSLALVIDWTVGQTDFPAGMLIPRNMEMNPDDLLSVNSQLRKFADRIMLFYDDAIRNAKQQLQQIREEVASLERRRNELGGPGAQGTP